MTPSAGANSLCSLLGCDYPVLLAGMGGVSRWELAAAVANAGGFGMLGMVRESPALITEEVTWLKAAGNEAIRHQDLSRLIKNGPVLPCPPQRKS